MAVRTVMNLPDEVHHALEIRAAKHGSTVEAEVLQILAKAVKAEQTAGVGATTTRTTHEQVLSEQELEFLAQLHRD